MGSEFLAGVAAGSGERMQRVRMSFGEHFYRGRLVLRDESTPVERPVISRGEHSSVHRLRPRSSLRAAARFRRAGVPRPGGRDDCLRASPCRGFSVVELPAVSKTRSAGFSLVELLVVIGIITLLIAILLPLTAAARGEARGVRCMANIRELGEALSMYANDFRSKYPVNTTTPSPGLSWYDLARIGRYLPVPTQANPSVYACPDDDGYLSYSMNFWASGAIDTTYPQSTKNLLWGANVANGSQMILLVESWSSQGTAASGYSAPSFVGQKGSTEGQRFGAGSGVPTYRAGRIGLVNCELPYMRHRKMSGPGSGLAARGRITIAFADGHAEFCTSDALADYTTGISARQCWWYAGDPP